MALRRGCALVLMLLVVIETGGLARAFAADASVHCCCGEHSAARRCDCKSCPVSLRGHRAAATGDRLTGGGPCRHATVDGAVLIMLALEAPALPVLASDPPARAPCPLPAALVSAIMSADRPPP